MKIEWHASVINTAGSPQVCGNPRFGASVQKSRRSDLWHSVVIVDNRIKSCGHDTEAEAKKACETILIEKCEEMGIDFPEFRE